MICGSISTSLASSRKTVQEDVMSQHFAGTQSKKKIPASTWIFFIVYLILFPAIPFFSAGTFLWPAAWWYYGASVAATTISRLIVARVNPDQLRERGTSLSADNVMPWDRWLSNLVGMTLPVVTLIVVGLDHRWAWSPALPDWVATLSFILLLSGYALATWAFVANRFFSGVVRIQEDRGHEVVTSGPYRYVRHPGYLGGLLSLVATPPLLGSLWGFIPAIFYLLVIIIRTRLEDQMLQEHLQGYEIYTLQTRYRLLPGIW
jgi:protein-S-isoprenylcysteine O-methyltransferase Ste14